MKRILLLLGLGLLLLVGLRAEEPGKSYRDGQNGFSIRYPVDWTVKGQPGSSGLIRPI